MSSWDKYHTYIEQAQENVVDGTKDFQINIITEWGCINTGLDPTKGKRPSWETKKEDHIGENFFMGLMSIPIRYKEQDLDLEFPLMVFLKSLNF